MLGLHGPVILGAERAVSGFGGELAWPVFRWGELGWRYGGWIVGGCNRLQLYATWRVF
jgi:hypothetical protein